MEDGSFSKKAKKFTIKYWVVFAIIFIIALSMYIRLVGFYQQDWPYMRNIDSYFFYRHINSIVENNGTLPQHDRLMNVPDGFDQSRSSYDFYYYLSAYSYYFFRMFFPNMGVQDFLIWFPVLIASLVAIPSYFIGRTLYDRKAGIFTALFMVFMVPFVGRSLGGDPDSDGIVMLLMISSIAAFLVTYKGLDKEKIFSRKNIIYSVITGAIFGLFALTWGSYWFAFAVVAAFIVLKIIVEFFMTRKHGIEHIKVVWRNNKSLIGSFIMLLVVFYLITVSYFGPGFIANPVTSIFGSFGGVESVKGEGGSFPNVYVSVAEMMAGGEAKEVAIRAAGVDVANGVSNMPMAFLILLSPFLLTLVCVVYLIYVYYKRREHLDTLIFVMIWFVGFLFASIIAIRATIFLAPVYAICSAILLAVLWKIVKVEE